MTATYSKAWRDKVRPGAIASAVVLTELIDDWFSPSTVIDVGCGEGHLRDALRESGITATGVDGPWVDGPDVLVELERPPYPPLARAEVVCCLEVAEHIDAAHADNLVAWLCALAPIVIFSAAIPGQGGVGHVNEQWPCYWADKFAGHDYVGTGRARERVWDDDRLEPWYRQNLLIFSDHSAVLTREFGAWNDGCPALVHPDIWSIYRR